MSGLLPRVVSGARGRERRCLGMELRFVDRDCRCSRKKLGTVVPVSVWTDYPVGRTVKFE